tara:strand:+ start:172 stop:585 length:414 start_codon:yes stop_codon:yes gene_type:complete
MYLDLSNTADVKKSEVYLLKLIEGKSKIELKKMQTTRTIKLNSYLHVCITLYAIHFGSTLEEAKTDLKRLCSFMVYEKNGSKYLKETKKLNNDDCSKFVEWIRNFSAQNGCYIPDAEEYKTNKYTIDKEINNHKQYL